MSKNNRSDNGNKKQEAPHVTDPVTKQEHTVQPRKGENLQEAQSRVQHDVDENNNSGHGGRRQR